MNRIENSRIFLAGSLKHYRVVADHAKELRKYGYSIMSTWHDTYNPDIADELWVQRLAGVVNMLDMDDSNLLVLHHPKFSTSGGSNFEHGYMVAKGARVVFIGDCPNIYQQVAFLHFGSSVAFLEAFKSIRADVRK